MVRAAIRTVLQQGAGMPGGFGTSGPASLASLPGQMQGTTAAQEIQAAMMQNPAAQAALNPSINPYQLTGQGVPYGAYGNMNQIMFGGSPYASPYGFGFDSGLGGGGGGDIAGAVAGVPIGGSLPGMPGMAPILNYLQQQQQQQQATSGGSTGTAAGTSGTTSTTGTGTTTTTPASTTTPAATTTPTSTTTTTPAATTSTTTPSTTSTTTPTTSTSTTTPLTAAQQLQSELQALGSGPSPAASTTTPATPTTTTSTVQIPGTTITVPVTTTTDPTTGQTTTSATPVSTPATTTTSGTTPASTTPSTPQQTARLQYQKWIQSRPTRPTSNTPAALQQYQQQLKTWQSQAPAGIHWNRGQHEGWGRATGIFGQQNQRGRGWQHPGMPGQAGTPGIGGGAGGAGAGGVGGTAAGGAGGGGGGARSRLARACDCEVPPMAADLERTSLGYGKSECNRCTYPFARGQRKAMILGDQFPYLHGYNFMPGEQVYVRTKVVLYGTDELEEEDTEPWIMEDAALVNCDRTGAFVCLMDIDMEDVEGDTARGAGIIEAHARNSGRYARQSLDL